MIRHLGLSLLTAAIALGNVAPAVSQDKRPSGTVIIEGTSVGVGAGVTWGDGRLTYRGKEYAFSLKGLGIVEAGVSRASARGEVYDLKTVDDFPGTYLAARAGAAVGRGAGVASMVNAAGVTIRLTGVGKGVGLVVAAEGVEIALKP